MFLTFYYMAATWIQSWRLSAMRSKIMLMLSRSESLVLYSEPEPVLSDADGQLSLQLSSLSSKWCVNGNEARIGDLVWFGENKRGCSLFPTQRLDVTQWISFRHHKTLFPIEFSGASQVPLSADEKLHLLVEADYLSTPLFDDELNCSQIHLEDFGTPLSWRADDVMGVILETDVDNFAKLASSFMNSRLKMDDGMELLRIETVTVEGRACRLVNTDSIPIVRRPHAMTPDRWSTHVELLSSLSHAAEKAGLEGGSVAVPGYDWAVVTAGVAVLELDTPPSRMSLPEISASPAADNSPDSMYSLSQETREASPVHEASVEASPARCSHLLEEERSSADSFCSLDSASTLSAASHLLKHPVGARNLEPDSSPPARIIKLPSRSIEPDVLKTVEFKATSAMKPPNVLVYSESAAALENVKSVLQSTLHAGKYTVYALPTEQMLSAPWCDNTRLLVVWGSVPDRLAAPLVDYLLGGGQLLCLCSDLLLRVLPSFQTAEVREKELVRFSYSRWKRVPLMHHVFCYQASPSHPRFTDDKSLPPVPTSVEMCDRHGASRTLDVEVLGCEETWHTPSLLLATVRGGSGGGRAVFSQIHLEQEPSQYEDDEAKHKALKGSDAARLDILKDLLGTHLGLDCAEKNAEVQYAPAYFLGLFELKQEFLGRLQDRLQNGMLKLANLSLQLCGKGVQPAKATATLMPVLLHSCPEHFSTVEYFENLGSSAIGRLVVYAEVMTSSQLVLEGAPLHHGLAVVPVQQTRGIGRSGNAWLSPKGCAMFSVQLHIPASSYLGQHLPLVQHISALAVVRALRDVAGFPQLDVRLKWPNDIYAGSSVKLGGLVVASSVSAATAICNVGCGVNLSNGFPTTCINDMIAQLPSSQQGKKAMSLERLLALTFTEMERLIDLVQTGDVDKVLEQYYKYWLHSDARVTVCSSTGAQQTVTVTGIDEFGFLAVRGDDGRSFSVQPDGNTFDMLRGLITAKVY